MGSLKFNPSSSPQGLYEVSTTQLAPFGATLHIGDGREFVYGSAGATALAVGRVAQGALAVAGHGVDAYLATNEPLVGTRVVEVTTITTAVTENQYAEGFLVIGQAAGGGSCYKIAGHPAAAIGAVNITLADPLWETLAAGATTGLIAPLSKGCIIAGVASTTGAAVGVPVRDIPIANFGWFQTRGVCGVLQDGAWVEGSPLGISDGTAGALAALTGTAVDEPILAIGVLNNATTAIGTCKLVGL